MEDLDQKTKLVQLNAAQLFDAIWDSSGCVSLYKFILTWDVMNQELSSKQGKTVYQGKPQVLCKTY